MRYVICLLAIAGVVVSSLAYRIHYSTGVEPCDINAHWDCGTVNHSSYSTVPGIWWHLRDSRHPGALPGPAPHTGLPVAALGIAGYALIAIFAFFRRRWLVVFFAIFALIFAGYLSSIEDRVLEVWCLYCVISQCLIGIIAMLSAVWLFLKPRRA